MDKRIVYLLGILLATAVVRVPASYRSSSNDRPQEMGATRSLTKAESPTNVGADKDLEIIPESERGPWFATCQYYKGPDSNGNDEPQPVAEMVHLTQPLPNPENLSRNKWCLPDGAADEFLIATVPDPVNTHLALDFDRRVDAIQQAVQDFRTESREDYSYAAYWLPWDPSVRGEADLDKLRNERRLKEIREKQPGLLIFRKGLVKGRELFVFLIGETPTAGVNRTQLGNALRYMGEIDKTMYQGKPENRLLAQEVRLLGPSFSGSVASLEASFQGFSCPSLPSCFHIISGSATSRSALDSLAQMPGVRLGEVLHDDAVATEQFLNYAHKSGLELREIAVLVEGETTYGQHSSSMLAEQKGHRGEGEVLVVRFPREISRLRNAYPEDFGGVSTASQKAQVLPNQGLTFNLKDSRNNEDDVPNFSLGQMPLSQEAVLLHIAATLEREKIHYVGIVATDIFDTLFLVRFLRVACPDTRIFVLDSDLLLARATDTIPLEGTLSITTYPLFARNQYWTSDKHSPLAWQRVLFPSRYAQTTYNACVALLSTEKTMGYLREYSFPNGEGEKPPLWLTAIGRNSYWPVALLGAQHPAESSHLLSWRHTPPGQLDIRPESPSGGYLLACGLLFCLALVHLGGVFFSKSRRYWWMEWWLEFFSFDRADGLGTGKVFFLQLATLSLAAMCLVMFMPLWSFAFAHHQSSWGFWVVLGILLATSGFRFADVGKFYRAMVGGLSALCLLLATYRIYRVFRELPLLESAWQPEWEYLLFYWVSVLATLGLVFRAIWLQLGYIQTSAAQDTRKPDLKARREFQVVAVLAWVVFFLLVVLWRSFSLGGEVENIFFSYRSLDLANGVSPLPPFLALLGGFYGWAWVHLRRIRLWETRRPLIPTVSFDEHYQCAFQQLESELDGGLRNLFVSRFVSILVVLAVFVGILLFRPWHHLGSLEPWSLASTKLGKYAWAWRFDDLYICLLGLLYIFIVSSWARVLYGWSRLHQLLRRLERVPLRKAFERLPKKYYSWVPIWHSGGTRKNYILMTRSLECLNELLLCCDQGKLTDLQRHRDKIDDALKSVMATESDGLREKVDELAALRLTFRAAADYLLANLLLKEWGSGSSDSYNEEEEKERAKDIDYLPTLEKQKPVILGEEFVALRFLAFIRYVSMQLRNLLTFVSAAFILSLVSLRSYPFESHRAIGWGLTAIFAALGIGIVAVFAQMHRDPILSRIADTEPGKLGKGFYLRVVSFGALPLLTVLASQFPAIGRFLFSWVQPGLEALR